MHRNLLLASQIREAVPHSGAEFQQAVEAYIYYYNHHRFQAKLK
ncbi:IS3 family transposase [Paenibacillus sacheonensis]